MNTWKTMLKRTIRTFFQAALGYAAANAAGLVGSGEGVGDDALTLLLISSVAAGLAALMNLPDHGGKVEGVEMIEGAAVVKRINETEEDLPMAGQDEPEASDDE